MRIALFTDAYYPTVSGVVTSIDLLHQELVRLGHEVYIVTVNYPDLAETEENVIRLPSIPFRRWKALRIGIPISASNLKKIKALNLDIIHSHTEFSIGLMAKSLARKMKIPIVHTYHTMYEDYMHYLKNPIISQDFLKYLTRRTMKSFMYKIDLVIAPTVKTRNSLLSYQVRNQIKVIPTGIDLAAFQKISPQDPRVLDLRQSLGISPAEKIILSLGRVSEEKSIDEIIKAMPAVCAKEDKVRLLIVGDGPNKYELEQMAGKLNLAEAKIIFTGQVDHSKVALYYSLADVFVSASRTETQGLTIMEAMANRLALVIFDDTNIEGILEDGKSARLFSSQAGLEKALIASLKEQEKNQAMIELAYESVLALSKEKFGEAVEQVYLDLVHKK